MRRQLEDSQLKKMLGKSKQVQKVKFQLRLDGAIVKKGRLCISSVIELKDVILENAYSSA